MLFFTVVSLCCLLTVCLLPFVHACKLTCVHNNACDRMCTHFVMLACRCVYHGVCMSFLDFLFRRDILIYVIGTSQSRGMSSKEYRHPSARTKASPSPSLAYPVGKWGHPGIGEQAMLLESKDQEYCCTCSPVQSGHGHKDGRIRYKGG